MTEYRCKFCHKLLFKRIDRFGTFQIQLEEQEQIRNAYALLSVIEIKCSKCNKINSIRFLDNYCDKVESKIR